MKHSQRFLLGALAAGLLVTAAPAQSTWTGHVAPAGPAALIPPTGDWSENFDVIAGVVPAYMGLNNLNSTTLVTDPEAWCNIGQQGTIGLNGPGPYSGAYNLEMGMVPGLTSYHNVQNSMILFLDGNGRTDLKFNCRIIDGGEETNTFDGIWLSSDGVNWYEVYASWTSLVDNTWTTILNLDIGAAATPVNTAGQFYLMIAQEDNFPYLDLDGIGIDDILIGDAQPLPPTAWNFVELPTTFLSIANGRCEDFDGAAGTLQPHMAVTGWNITGGVADPNGWANIGQLGALNVASQAGTHHLELSRAPATTAANVAEALVLGLNGAGASTFDLEFYHLENNDELNGFDGVWVSQDGDNWYRLFDGVSTPANTWVLKTGLNMQVAGASLNLSGDFYLMFACEDNSAWTAGDGQAYDSIVINGGCGPTGPQLSVTGTCGGPVTFSLSSLTPGGQAALLYGPAGSTTKPSGVCAGTTVGISGPSVGAMLTADANGDAVLNVNVPAGACGLTVQAVDVGTCTPTNAVVL